MHQTWCAAITDDGGNLGHLDTSMSTVHVDGYLCHATSLEQTEKPFRSKQSKRMNDLGTECLRCHKISKLLILRNNPERSTDKEDGSSHPPNHTPLWCVATTGRGSVHKPSPQTPRSVINASRVDSWL